MYYNENLKNKTDKEVVNSCHDVIAGIRSRCTTFLLDFRSNNVCQEVRLQGNNGSIIAHHFWCLESDNKFVIIDPTIRQFLSTEGNFGDETLKEEIETFLTDGYYDESKGDISELLRSSLYMKPSPSPVDAPSGHPQ